MASHQTIVVELGSSRIKVGFAGESKPRRVLSDGGNFADGGGGWSVCLNDGMVSGACHWKVLYQYLSSSSGAASDGQPTAVATVHEWEKTLYPLFSHVLTSILFVQRPSRHRVLVLINDAYPPRQFREALHRVWLEYLGVGGVRLASGGVTESLHYLMEGMPRRSLSSPGQPKAYLLVDIGTYEARISVSVTGSSVLADTQQTTMSGYVSFLRQVLNNYQEMGADEGEQSVEGKPEMPVATLDDANAIVQAWAAISPYASAGSEMLSVNLPSEESKEGQLPSTQLPTKPLLEAFHQVYLDYTNPSSLIFAILSCATACPIDYRKVVLENVALLGGGAVALRHFCAQGSLEVEGSSAKGLGMQLEMAARDACGISGSEKCMEEGKEEEKKEETSNISSIARQRFQCLRGAAVGSIGDDGRRIGGINLQYPEPFAADVAAWIGGSIMGTLGHKEYRKKM